MSGRHLARALAKATARGIGRAEATRPHAHGFGRPRGARLGAIGLPGRCRPARRPVLRHPAPRATPSSSMSGCAVSAGGRVSRRDRVRGPHPAAAGQLRSGADHAWLRYAADRACLPPRHHQSTRPPGTARASVASPPKARSGVALWRGHPVYFVIFSRDPVEGQTILDVTAAEAVFLQTVIERHPKAPKPGVIGNCGGAEATMLVASAVPDLLRALGLHVAPSRLGRESVGLPIPIATRPKFAAAARPSSI